MNLFTPDVVAIVTGASSGIGVGTAIKLVEKGVTKMCLTGRNVEALKETKTKCIKESGSKIPEGDILIVDGDLTKEETCSKIVSSTINEFNRIDILVNNAGIFHYEPFETCGIKEYDSVMDVNVRSIVVLTQKCVPYLKVTKGSVVNVSSALGLHAMRNCTYYSMSKAALDMFTKSMALELGHLGVRVNGVNPGMVKVNIQDSSYQQRLERAKTTHPIGRYGEVEDVANLIAFLASSQASFMTGSVVPIDGGLLHNLIQ